MSTVSIAPEKPVRPFRRQREYLAAGISKDQYGNHINGNARNDRRRLRAKLNQELRRLTDEARR